MSRQFKAARLNIKMTTAEACEKLGIAQPTLSAWENEKKTPSVEAIERMADLYGVSTDYLLGRPAFVCDDPMQPINKKVLPVLNGMPVWSEKRGWMLVSTALQQLLLENGELIPFSDAGELFIAPRAFSVSPPPFEDSLDREDVFRQTEVWVEPISSDSGLRNELRGWYRVFRGYVENQSGNRFLKESYGAKWMAFIQSNI